MFALRWLFSSFCCTTIFFLTERVDCASFVKKKAPTRRGNIFKKKSVSINHEIRKLSVIYWESLGDIFMFLSIQIIFGLRHNGIKTWWFTKKLLTEISCYFWLHFMGGVLVLFFFFCRRTLHYYSLWYRYILRK